MKQYLENTNVLCIKKLNYSEFMHFKVVSQ